MKALFALLLVGLLSSSASAQFSVDMPSLQYPTKSQWALAMIEKACNVEFDSTVSGTITEVGTGVIYDAITEHGEIIASAAAASTSLFAKKTCL